MTATADIPSAADLSPLEHEQRGTGPTGVKKSRYGTHIFLIAMSVLWLIPLLWTLYTSLRPKADTDKYGYFSVARQPHLQQLLDGVEAGAASPRPSSTRRSSSSRPCC